MCAPGWPCRIPATLKDQENYFVAGHPSCTSEVSPAGRGCLRGPGTEELRPGWVWLCVHCRAGLNLPKSLIGVQWCVTAGERECFVDRCHRLSAKG